MSVAGMLSQVSSLRRTQQKLALLSGENFNVFRILKMESKEVGTHSAFLGELLNPAGSHGMKDTFLKLFIEQIVFPEFNTEGAKLVVEKYIGQIDADYLQGGRIDIYLESKGEYLFIENKIYAIDQRNQLLRYHKHNRKARLLYLTLNGDEYAGGSDDMQSEKHYHRLSYQKDITRWLDRCHQAAAAHPIVRETIVQYIYLVNHLTGRTPNNFMKEETKQLILGDSASYESAWDCKQMIEELEREVPKLVWAQLKTAWSDNVAYVVCHVGAYPVIVEFYKEDPASDIYYFFSIEPLTEGGEIPLETQNLFTQRATETNPRLRISHAGSVWTPFPNLQNPDRLSRQELFDFADSSKRAKLIDSIIEQAVNDAALLRISLEGLN